MHAFAEVGEHVILTHAKSFVKRRTNRTLGKDLFVGRS